MRRIFEPTAAELACLVAEYEAADHARTLAERRYAFAADVLGRSLVATGPRVVGPHLYRGFASILAGGTPCGVVFRELADAPAACGCDPAPEAGHACTDVRVFEDDGDPD